MHRSISIHINIRINIYMNISVSLSISNSSSISSISSISSNNIIHRCISMSVQIRINGSTSIRTRININISLEFALKLTSGLHGCPLIASYDISLDTNALQMTPSTIGLELVAQCINAWRMTRNGVLACIGSSTYHTLHMTPNST